MHIGLIDILKLAGFDSSIPTKLARHQSKDFPIATLRQEPGLFELYQSYQSKPVFHKVNQVVSFYGMAGTKAGFYGIYKVKRCIPASEGVVPRSGNRSDVTSGQTKFYYDLALDERSADLRDRLVIDWGGSTRMWAQLLSNKTVVELLAPGRKLAPFTDYLEFSLPFEQLQNLVASDGSSHRDWKAPLDSVAGIYLISDETSGDLYVGSAYGADGIWGRWKKYGECGHGGNKLLMKLLERDPDRKKHFRFSVLQTLPKSMRRDEVISREVLYKQKFGKRATALNGN
jgi:hypothetical protein